MNIKKYVFHIIAVFFLIAYSKAIIAQTLTTKIKIAMGNVWQDYKADTSINTNVVTNNIKIEIKNILGELSQKYDYEFVTDSSHADLIVNGHYMITTDLDHTKSNKHIQRLYIEFKRKSHIAGAYTVESKHDFLSTPKKLEEPVTKILDFLISTRISTHTKVLSTTSVLNINTNLRQVVLKPSFGLKVIEKDKLQQLLVNMFVDVQRKKLRSKPYRFRVFKKMAKPVQTNEIVVYANFSEGEKGKYKLSLSFVDGDTTLRQKTIEFDKTLIHQDQFVEFITKVYPQINYFRSVDLN